MRVQRQGALEQRGFGLDSAGVGQAALHGADHLAGFSSVKADALRAEIGVDLVDAVTLGDGAVRAFGLAGSAIDAEFRDTRGHADCFRSQEG